MRRTALLIAAFVVLLIAGFALARWNEPAPVPVPEEAWSRLPQEQRRAALAHELEVMGLTTAAAGLIREGETEKALRLLEQRLARSTETADVLVGLGGRLSEYEPNLKLVPERARDYAVTHGLPEVAARSERISEGLRVR
jgi:hypothetical protein